MFFCNHCGSTSRGEGEGLCVPCGRLAGSPLASTRAKILVNAAGNSLATALNKLGYRDGDKAAVSFLYDVICFIEQRSHGLGDPSPPVGDVEELVESIMGWLGRHYEEMEKPDPH